MALKGLDIFKLSPKTNCKECGCPTCMAFCMKVAQGALPLDNCPHFSPEAVAQLSEATAPPMKTIKVGAGEAERELGGETVLYRHEKTFVHENLFAVAVTPANFDEKWAAVSKVDYERIGERMYVEALCLEYEGDVAAYAELAAKAAATGRLIIIDCADAAAARAAAETCKDAKPIINGATVETMGEFNALATELGCVLGVTGDSIEAIYDGAAAAEAADNKNLILDVGAASIKDAFANAVRIRRGALTDQDRTLGYPSIVNAAKLAPGDMHMQNALASLFVCKYGSIIVMEDMTYAEALPLYGLRQNIFTDPQKPMRVEPGVYALNGADENSICCTTVDFALTYFVVSGELERSGVPVNMIITDAGGYSVLTAWAAGKLSASSIAKYIQENGLEEKLHNKTLILPGKVAVLKGEVEQKLPDWKIVVGPNEATDLVRFMKEFA